MIKEEEAILSWKELSCSYPSKRSGEPNITTLSNVTGHIRYQELVAIMGGSGGGKSTLMDILSGRKTLGNLSGEMSVLGTEMSPSSMDCKNILRDVAAYVPQNEQFFPNQTPEEAVEFAANLKLGRDERGDHVRKSRVREMLDLVGIPVKARTRSIGGTLAGGVVLRGLSGGERKRLALACAFAMKPKLIFLDEITSGLDSENAVVVIDL
jgi:ATP-binding cassette subfamily G (WHITE) protein 2